jgi:hypothetical protein
MRWLLSTLLACGVLCGSPAALQAQGATSDLALPAEFTVPPEPAFPAYREPSFTLRSVDVELVRRVAVGRRCEQQASGASACLLAWTAIAEYGTEESNPYREFGRGRIEAWQRFEQAKSKRQTALSTLEQSYRADIKSLAEESDYERAKARAERVKLAYQPFEAELRSLDLGDLPKPKPAKSLREWKSVAPLSDPFGQPDVLKQRVIVQLDAGAYAQSFKLDSSDELLSNAGAVPDYDLSGFFAGGRVIVNVAQEADLAIGLLVHGRVHVGTGLPIQTFVSGSTTGQQLAPPEQASTTSFVIGAGPRLAANVLDRIGMSVALELGYLQVMAPGEVPGCGVNSMDWDPALRGFQGDLVVGFEFYPLSLLSLGLGGRVGFGHVESEWCAAASSGGDYGLLDVSADSFGAGAQGSAALHF